MSIGRASWILLTVAVAAALPGYARAQQVFSKCEPSWQTAWYIPLGSFGGAFTPDDDGWDRGRFHMAERAEFEVAREGLGLRIGPSIGFEAVIQAERNPVDTVSRTPVDQATLGPSVEVLQPSDRGVDYGLMAGGRLTLTGGPRVQRRSLSLDYNWIYRFAGLPNEQQVGLSLRPTAAPVTIDVARRLTEDIWVFGIALEFDIALPRWLGGGGSDVVSTRGLIGGPERSFAPNLARTTSRRVSAVLCQGNFVGDASRIERILGERARFRTVQDLRSRLVADSLTRVDDAFDSALDSAVASSQPAPDLRDPRIQREAVDALLTGLWASASQLMELNVTAPVPRLLTTADEIQRGIDVPSGVVAVGTTARGVLSESDQQSELAGQAWTLHGEAGETVVVDLISYDFDAYLRLLGHGLSEANDDGGEGLDSRIEITFPETGTYTLVVGSYRAEGSGEFLLSVSPR